MQSKISNQDKRLLDIAIGYLDKCVNHLTFINIDANVENYKKKLMICSER